MTRDLTKTVTYDPETGDFRLELGGELVGWARSESEGKTRLDELAFDILRRAQPAIDASVPVTAEAVDAILAQREDEAQREQVRAEALDDQPGIAYAAAQRRAISRARGFIGRAARAGRTLARELLDGSWQIVGSQGDVYTVSRAGLTLSCSCPHGDRMRQAVAAALHGHEQAPPRGTCWHTILIPAVEEATEQRLAERDAEVDARAVYALAA